MTKKKGRGTAEQGAANQEAIVRWAKNPLIPFSEIANLLGVSRAYVHQVASNTKGLIEQREADRKRFFGKLKAGLPKIMPS